jgi:NAD(P)-dependent dehydrogenase (short-subunit alcohol dehydrogenase family)
LAANPYIPAYCASKAGLLGRIGQPDEVAQAVAFLMSPKAPFITGTYLVVDGGVVSRHA